MEIRNRFLYSSFQSRLDELEEEVILEENDQLIDSCYRDLNIYICTWNVNTRQPNFCLNELINFDKEDQPHVCVFGFQEINSKPIQRILDYFYNDPWTNKLTDILSAFGYLRLKSTRLVGIILNIYVKKSILPYVKCCNEDWIRLGFWGLWGNKGANIGTINIGGLNICFVNSHLSAHEDQDKARLIEHSKIMYHNFKFANNHESVHDQNYLFLFGDLNFRVENLKINEVKDLIDKNDFKTLMENDQLKKCINKEKCFSFFNESEIKFAPTYKFELNTDTYDLSKPNRVPSWCDRILYKLNNKQEFFECKALKYDSIPNLKQSDHKPVYGQYQIKTFNWEIEPPMVIFIDILANEEQNLDINYQVSKNSTTHPKDWVGVYDPNFKSLNEYKTYIWAAKISELENKNFEHSLEESIPDINQHYIKRKIILEQFYVKSGYYVLGYYSYILNSLIGLSSVFQVKLS